MKEHSAEGDDETQQKSKQIHAALGKMRRNEVPDLSMCVIAEYIDDVVLQRNRLVAGILEAIAEAK